MTGPHRVASSDGVVVALHDLGGDPSAPVMLVCHATGFCARAYEPLAAELAGQFHLYGLDFRGHGDSSAPHNGEFGWDRFADDLLAVADDLGGGPFVGFGHSLGGGVLLLAEARRPGLLSAAYLWEPIVIPAARSSSDGEHVPGDDQMSTAARKRRAAFPSKAEALARYASRPPLNVLQAGALAAYVEHGMTTEPDGTARLKCTPEQEAATFEGGGKPTLEDLAEVGTPTTVAIGTTERGWTPAAFGPAIADALPNGRLERHRLLGHFGPLQGPATVGAMILDELGLG